MSSSVSIDVAVVGAGPAGSVLARRLAAAGREVLLLEAKKLPRHKTCAGGLPPRAVRALGLDGIAGIARGRIREVALDGAWNGRHVIGLAPMAPPGAGPDGFGALVVERAELDALLARAAVAAGAGLLEKCRCRQVRRTRKGFELETSRGLIRAWVVCACDGARSLVGRDLGFAPNAHGLCLETLVPAAPGLDAVARGRAVLDIAAIRHGYAWAFPRRDGFSVGTGSFFTQGLPARLRQVLADFIRRTPELDAAAAGECTVRGCLLPAYTGPKPFYAMDNAYIAGDAAGLVDPLTGEGIYHAARGAAHAAAAILENRPELYGELLHSDLVPELEKTRRLSRQLGLAPRWLVRGLLSLPRFRHKTNGLMRILAGG